MTSSRHLPRSLSGPRPVRVARPRLLGVLGLAIVLVVLSAVPVFAGGPRGGGGPHSSTASDGSALTADSWIVQLVPSANPALEAPGMARRAGGTVGHVYQAALNGFQFRGSAQAAAALAHNPHVSTVSPDRPVQLIESLPNGIERIWAFDNDTPADSAYHQGFRGAGARIAVLDTGVDMDHPDLVGSIDAASAKNCVNPALPPEDGYGHGTHVSGTALAPLNGVGVVGVAPEARLVPVKIFDDAGNSSESLVLCGFNHVMTLNTDGNPANDVDVVSMSFGEDRSWGDCVTDPLHTAVCNANAAGIIMVAGAGNSAVNAGTFVPAAFPEVVSVSALADFDATRGGLAGCGLVPDLGWFDCDDTFAFFSNYGASVDVIAPGVSIFSTTKNGGYATQSGTSMATPHVSGVVAVMVGVNPGLTPAGALAFLQQSGECPDGSTAGVDGVCTGQGTWADDPDGTPEPMVNALHAAQAAGGTPPAPTAPAAPTLTAATAGNGSVALTWTTPADGGSTISGYEVWRSTTTGSEAFHVTVPVQNGYTDSTNVTNGTTYFYKVKAVNGVGPGPLSNELSATPVAPPAPTAPAAPSLTAATAGNGSVALTWTTPADGGSTISGYEVWRSTTTGSEAFHVTVPVQNGYTDSTNVTNGTTYFYKVKAVNGVGPGPLSNELSATPVAPPPMVTRTGGTVSNFASATSNAGSVPFSLPAGSNAVVAMLSMSSTTVTVTGMTWRPDPGNPSADQALTFVGRQTAPSAGAVEVWVLLNPTPGVSGSALSHTLSASVKRIVGVHALSGVGTVGSPVSAGVNSTSIGVTVPSVSGGLVLDVLYGQNSTTSYTAGAGQTERWDTNTTGGLNNLRGAGSEETGATSVAMTWTAGSKAKMALLAVGFSPEPPPAPTAPAAPTLTAATAGNGSVALTWTTPADGGSTISGYEVWRSTTTGSEAFHVTVPVQNGYTDSTNVTNGTTYFYKVKAVNGVGPGPLSNELSATPVAPPAPTAPAAPSLTAATAGNGSVALTWTTPADGGSTISGYEVWRSTTTGSEAFHVTVPVQNGYTDSTNVTNGTTYFYKVKAVNGVGPGPLSNELSATPVAPPAPTAPAAPTLTAATAGNGSVALTWTTPADGGSTISGYEVWRSTTTGSEAFHVTVPVQNGYTDSTNVTNGTTYFYKVKAVNGVGPGPLSNELSATPVAPPPMVTRTGGTVSNFASATSNAGSVPFSLPAGSNAVVAMLSMSSTTVTVTGMTWRPDPGNPSADQALTFVGRQTAPSAGAVEVWVLLNPTPGVSGSALSHTLSASVKRIVGVHALSGVGTVGSPVSAGVNSTSIGVTVPSVSGGLVLDVLYGQNSTTSYTAGAGQTERWDTNTTGGLNNLRGAGSEETGATSVAMTWTAGSTANMALLAVGFSPSP